METITIYYYTAWNGYSWQGCDSAAAADLQRYMEAAGVLPGSTDRTPLFGGAIACQVADRMGVAVYRCGVRVKGDAFGRDSLFIAVAFIPLGSGLVDFAALLSLPQMSPSAKGELSPVSVPQQGLVLETCVDKDTAWRETSCTERHHGIEGLRKTAALFLGHTCQLGLLQASFSSESGRVEDVMASLSYRVFPEVTALVEASRNHASAKRLARGALAADHPARLALLDAVNQLRTRRANKMPEYTGLARYIAEREAELDDGATDMSAASSQSSRSAARSASSRFASAKDGSRIYLHLGWMLLSGILVVAIVFFAALRNKKLDKEQKRVVELQRMVGDLTNENESLKKKAGDLKMENEHLQKTVNELRRLERQFDEKGSSATKAK